MLFQHEAVPSNTKLVGLAALVAAFNVQAPLRKRSVVSDQLIRGHVRESGAWKIYESRFDPEDTVQGHLGFAMRHEVFDLLVLKRVFDAIPAGEIASFVNQAPTGIPQRRAWFLYEHLTQKTVDIPDASKSLTAIEALDSKQYFTTKGTLSRRHRVKDNLLGVRGFCPTIRRTPELEAYAKKDLSKKAKETVGRVSASVVARAASFLLLADSKASFEIEKERPPRSRIEKWGRAVMQVGKHPLTLDEILRLHGILIDDPRFSGGELRKYGVFLGDHTADGEPVPEFIGARADDLNGLLSDLILANSRMKDVGLDPVIQAAATAFGFVYVHPFGDGNGRLHRCLIHQVLSERQFTPPGVLFPVSAAMLDWIDEYQKMLQAHSQPLMPYIEWTPTVQGNVEVTNETVDLYRYFDCTVAAEFLYRCVERTVEKDLPREIDYLKRRDEALRRIMDMVDVPNQMAEQFVLYAQRNGGILPKKRRKEFYKLTDDEVRNFESVVQDAFDGYEPTTRTPFSQTAPADDKQQEPSA